MKRVLLLLLLVFTFNFVLASVEVNNYSIDKFYSPFENISGEINITITNENYDDLITSNDGDEISLGDFLDVSGNLFECSPPDCSKDYRSFNGVIDKSFDVSSLGKTYVGFVLTGEDVEVTDLSFELESNFDINPEIPLTINFFEKEDWKFNKFSEEFLDKDYGCYDSSVASIGSLIGKTLYCEMINIPETNLIRVGAVVGGDDNVGVNMTVYPESGTGGSWTCSYNPNSTEDGCDVSSGLNDLFSAGNYQVCVSASGTTGYRIYDESVEDNCGFVQRYGVFNSTKDYAIFAQVAKYADASFLDSEDFNNQDIVDAANSLIQERYGGDCLDGCVLPLAISGISQNVRIYDVSLGFTRIESDLSDLIYDLDVTPVTVDFDGVLDLSSLGFSVSGAMKYVVSFGSKKLFSELLDVLPAPIILSVFPLNPPASVPIKFYVGVNYTDNKSLTYKWNFGDNSTETTNIPYTTHTYSDLKDYSLTLEVSAGGNLTSTKNFVVSVISPEIAVNTSLISKRNALNSIIVQLATFPTWYGEPLGKLINVLFFEGELDRLDREKANAFIDSDFIDIAKDLYALDIPTGVIIESFNSPYLITNVGDIDIEPVQIIGGAVSGATNEKYERPIINWQNLNIDAEFISKAFSVLSYNNEINDIFRTYSFNVNLKDSNEAYFVINKPLTELYFKESVGARKAGDATTIILNAGSNVSFEFYCADSEPVTFFVSPKLSSLVVEADIDTTCNFNNICEKEYGENSDTCRSDCRPVFGAIIYLILSFIFILVLYSVLQIWYKRRYENYLFKDRRQLYNILMYVTNARARGMKDDRVAAELRKQGWSSERVNYIIKKSIGKRTGLYEIIPFEKILAFFRNRKAKKVQAARFATNPQQQTRRNINKSEFQRRV